MNDKQKYKLIIWHAFLEDMASIKEKIEIRFPGHKIQWGKMAKYFDWHINNRKNQQKLYPWCIFSRNKKGPLKLSYSYLRNFEPEEHEQHEDPTTDFPNRYHCDTCQKFVMKNSKSKHLKTNKHNRYI